MAKRSAPVKIDEVMTLAFAAGGIWIGWKIVQALFNLESTPPIMETVSSVFQLTDDEESPVIVRAPAMKTVTLRKDDRGVYVPAR